MTNLGNEPSCLVHSPHSPAANIKTVSITRTYLRAKAGMSFTQYPVITNLENQSVFPKYASGIAQHKKIGWIFKEHYQSKTVFYLTRLSKIFVSNHFLRERPGS